MRRTSKAAASIFALFVSASAVFAANVYQDWEAHSEKDMCYTISFPNLANSSPNPEYKFMTVTNRPGKDTKNEIAIKSGLGDDANLEGSVSIDGNLPFKLLVYQGFGYVKSGDTESDMVKQMKAGKKLEVKWTTMDGNYTVDTYSLKGFTAAYNDASKCG